ncbi:uncharacterized protein LOC127749832 [Frankliniella occidentalis]|uniref:Uncharacterized protein LOC127749832 n=1 Tax=Frankliniella occidentalis TaxID=133901 RepID=A0A9C6U153_FRAOC|nr:uncharacterized protein LOC127749832 [Frankliniella occidentalis]
MYRYMALLLVPLAVMCHEGTHGKRFNSLVGPFIASVDRYYMCEPNNRPLPWRWHLRTTHFNPHKPKELQHLTGNITANETFDDSCWGRVILDAWSNNQWKENAFVFYFKNNGCKAFKENIPGLYDLVFKKTETKGTCKMKPGVYELNNAPINWTYPKVPIMPYGHFRFRLTIGRAENLFACLVVECYTVPKVE